MKELLWSANISKNTDYNGILCSNTRKTKSEYDSHKTDSKYSELACDCNNEILCHLI